MHETPNPATTFDVADTMDERFDWLILWVLGGLLLFMPAALGAYAAWSEGIAMVGISALAMLLALKLLLRPDLRFIWSWAYLPIALFFLLVGVQLLPLPAEIVRLVSPHTLLTKTALLSDLPGAAERLKHVSLSFYHEETWRDLRRLVAVTVVFVVTVNIFRSVSQIKELLWIIAIVGVFEGALAIAQMMTGSSDIYWTVPPPSGWPFFGTFPSHNFFAQFMNFSSGTMLSLLLVTLDKTFRRHDYTAAEVVEKLRSSEFRPAWLLATMLAVCAASVFLSLSRGGMLSLAGAGVVVGVFLTFRGGARGMGIMGWIAGLLLIVVFAIVVAGGANLVEARMLQIGNQKDRATRLRFTADTFKIWQDFPMLGTGLGSFDIVFPGYSHSVLSSDIYHAENDYVQLLAETGVVGVVIAAGFVGVIAGCFFRAQSRGRRGTHAEAQSQTTLVGRTRRIAGKSGGEASAGEFRFDVPPDEFSSGRSPGAGSRRQYETQHRRSSHGPSPISSLAIGLCFGLVAILMHSATDFAQHYLSTACLTAVGSGLLVNLATLRRRERGIGGVDPFTSRGSLTLRIGGVLVVAVICGLTLEQVRSVWFASNRWDRAIDIGLRLQKESRPPDPGDIKDIRRAEDAAVAERPENIEYRFGRAVSRFVAISDVRDPVTSQFVYTPEKRKTLDEIHADLNDARWIAPTFGPSYAQLGQWEYDSMGRLADGARHIRMGLQLAPNDSTVCFIAATLDADEGNWPGSVSLFDHAAVLEPSMRQDAIDIFISYYDRPDMALELAGDDVDRLRALSRQLRERGKNPPTTGPATRPADEAIASAAELRVDDVIRRSADREDASSKMLAEMGLLCLKQQRPDQAIPYLSHALDLDYGKVEWRLEYARALVAVGRNQEAIHQAQIILRQQPQLEAAANLIDRLSTPSTHAPHERNGTAEH